MIHKTASIGRILSLQAEGKTHAEIAEIIGTQRQTVGIRLRLHAEIEAAEKRLKGLIHRGARLFNASGESVTITGRSPLGGGRIRVISNDPKGCDTHDVSITELFSEPPAERTAHLAPCSVLFSAASGDDPAAHRSLIDQAMSVAKDAVPGRRGRQLLIASDPRHGRKKGSGK